LVSWSFEERTMLYELDNDGHLQNYITIKLNKTFGTTRTIDAIKRQLYIKHVDEGKKLPYNQRGQHYSEKQIAYLIRAREEGLNWNEITENFATEFKHRRSVGSLQHKYSNTLKKLTIQEKESLREVTMDDYDNLFNEKQQERLYLKKIETDIKHSKEYERKRNLTRRVDRSNVIEGLTRQGCVWTEREDIKLLMLWNNSNMYEIRNEMCRTYGACAYRYENIKFGALKNSQRTMLIAKNKIKLIKRKAYQDKFYRNKINRLMSYINNRKQKRINKKINKLQLLIQQNHDKLDGN